MNSCIMTLVILAAATQSSSAQQVRFVDDTAPGGNTGTSWTDAHLDLRVALSASVAGDEVWVAEGTYRPSLPIPGGGSRSDSFDIPSGVAVYGGFDGTEATLLDRAGLFDATILTGDLNGDDLPGFVNDTENSFHVVSAVGAAFSTVMDGFLISGGHANGPAVSDKRGAGLNGESSEAQVRNCRFISDRTVDSNDSRAGGLYMTSSGIVSDCHFEGNFSRRGGGAYLAGGAVIEDSSFDSNTALGGGLFLANSFATRCSFSNNQGFNEGGGGMRVEGTGTVTECVFADNHGGFNLGGGGISIRSSTANIVDCAFLNNTGPFRGGGIYVLQASPLIRGCYFEGNSAVEGGGMAVRVDTGAPPQITDCVFESNTAQDFGGGLGLDDTRAEVLRCSFRRNFATIKGGGAGTWEIGGGGAVKFVSCEFLANGAGGAGGGLASDFHQGSGPTFVTNSLFAWNYAGSQGGGIRAGFGPLVITNCTIAFNVADSGGGLVVEGPIAKTVANSTLWGNSHFQSAGESANLLGANVFIDYSCVEGWTGLLGGTGNFSADPLFVNPCGCDNLYGTDDDDFRLQTGSPCANVGDDASVPTDVFDVDDDGDTAEALPLDLAGSARFVGAVDMGALEGTFVPDCGSNGIANNYCQTSPNSVDAVGAIIGYVGSLNLSDANLTLTSGPVASGSFGLFYYGPNRINAPFGDGFRCVGGNTSRLNPPVQADGLGVASRTLNFAAIPLASGPNAVFPGSTWNFQYWYRDGMAGMTGFNLSDGLSISFCP